MSSWFLQYGFSPVLDDLLVGAFPLDGDDVRALSDAGVERVYNLCEDVEYETGERDVVERALAEAGIEERRLPLVDYGGIALADIDRAVDDVRTALGEGHRVYLHCRAGWQRSAAVAAGVIALEEDVPIEQALDVLRERKPSSVPLDHQRADVVSWWLARSRREVGS